MGKPQIDNARRAATAALVRLHGGGWSHLAAAGALADPALTARDRAFAGALFFTAAERLATLDWALAPHLRRGVEELDVEVRAILECGAAQLLYMRVPHSAAVNESVKLARVFGKTSAAGLVNAVLRKVAALPVATGPEDTPAGPNLAGVRFESEQRRVEVQWSVGPAVAAAVMESLPDAYDAFFAASFSGGAVTLRANSLKTTPEALAARLNAEGARAEVLALPGAVRARLPGVVTDDEAFKAGLYQVQGLASQVACACLGVRPGQRVLDVCAAPGGKTATLAQYLGGGAGLTACELRENRLPLITRTLERLGIAGAEIKLWDGTVYDPALAAQDRVLCDVPCSGLGVLAQKPDLRLAAGANFEALPALQLKLLSTAARYLKQGGRLVYSTCTVRRQENQGVVQAFLAGTPGFKLAPPAVRPPGAVLEGEMMTLLPHTAGTDGFFVATLEKI